MTDPTSLLQHFDSLALSENYGELCGLLCLLETDTAITLWRSYSELFEIADAEGKTLLEQMVEDTNAQLYSDEFEFKLLLPEDSDDLQMRVHALRLYCRGLLSGIGLSGLKSLDILDADAQSFIKDINMIAESGIDTDGSEADEANYAEISEYIRAGTMLVARDDATRTTSRTLH